MCAVFAYENNDKDFSNLQTLYNTTERNENVCNLLLLKNDTTEHLCWIKDLSKLKKKTPWFFRLRLFRETNARYKE